MSDTVATIKAKIFESHGVSVDHQSLFFSSEYSLSDFCTLASYLLVRPSSTLHLVTRSDPWRKLFVFNDVMSRDGLIAVDAAPECTVGSVIASLSGANSNLYCTSSFRYMDAEEVLSASNTSRGHTFVLVSCRTQMQVFVTIHVNSGITRCLDVFKGMSIKTIRHIIQDKEGIPPAISSSSTGAGRSRTAALSPTTTSKRRARSE